MIPKTIWSITQRILFVNQKLIITKNQGSFNLCTRLATYSDNKLNTISPTISPNTFNISHSL